MYLEQNIFGHNLLKFQFNISSLAIFIFQSKFKKKYFLIFSSFQPITSPVSRHVIFASSPITIICSPEGQFTWHDGLVCFENVVRKVANLVGSLGIPNIAHRLGRPDSTVHLAYFGYNFQAWEVKWLVNTLLSWLNRQEYE